MKQKIIAKVYFAVEVQYVNGERVELGRLGRDTVPHYLCYFESGAESQVLEEGCFFIHDDHDRLWFCKEIIQTDPAKQPGYADQFFRMGYLAHKIGVNEGGTMFHGVAENEEDLREKLGDVK